MRNDRESATVLILLCLALLDLESRSSAIDKIASIEFGPIGATYSIDILQYIQSTCA